MNAGVTGEACGVNSSLSAYLLLAGDKWWVVQLGLGNGTEQGHLKPIQRVTLVPGLISISRFPLAACGFKSSSLAEFRPGLCNPLLVSVR